MYKDEVKEEVQKTMIVATSGVIFYGTSSVSICYLRRENCITDPNWNRQQIGSNCIVAELFRY